VINQIDGLRPIILFEADRPYVIELRVGNTRCTTMPRKKITFETVVELAGHLADVEQGTMYGAPALKVRGNMFTCLASHRSAEPDTLVVRLDFERRDELITSEADTYYLTYHYVGYPCVLVRLRRIPRDALRDLLQMAWRFVRDTSKPRNRR
jgi:hypothetical protein